MEPEFILWGLTKLTKNLVLRDSRLEKTGHDRSKHIPPEGIHFKPRLLVVPKEYTLIPDF